MNKLIPSTAPKAVVRLALALVGFSLFNMLLLDVISDPPLAKTIQRGLRFLFTCLLSYYLCRGAGWARWVVLALSALAVLGSFIGMAIPPENVPWLFRTWLGIMGAFYLVVALLLVIPSRITRYFASA